MNDRNITLTPKAVALTIAGSDPSGGAGLQADLKAFQQNGVYGMSVVTLLTVQNTTGVQRVELLEADLIRDQFESVTSDIPPLAIKTGALGDAKTIELVADLVRDFNGPVIVDPVMISKHGDRLADDSAIDAYREKLFPLATLVTPNRYEAAHLLGEELEDIQAIVNAAGDLQALGPDYVLIKAGVFEEMRQHIYGDPEGVLSLGVANHDTPHTHGAGCSLSAVITAQLALGKGGNLLQPAMRSAVDFAIAAVNHAITFVPELGQGNGPIESRVLHIGD